MIRWIGNEIVFDFSLTQKAFITLIIPDGTLGPNCVIEIIGPSGTVSGSPWESCTHRRVLLELVNSGIYHIRPQHTGVPCGIAAPPPQSLQPVNPAGNGDPNTVEYWDFMIPNHPNKLAIVVVVADNNVGPRMMTERTKMAGAIPIGAEHTEGANVIAPALAPKNGKSKRQPAPTAE